MVLQLGRKRSVCEALQECKICKLRSKHKTIPKHPSRRSDGLNFTSTDIAHSLKKETRNHPSQTSKPKIHVKTSRPSQNHTKSTPQTLLPNETSNRERNPTQPKPQQNPPNYHSLTQQQTLHSADRIINPTLYIEAPPPCGPTKKSRNQIPRYPWRSAG